MFDNNPLDDLLREIQFYYKVSARARNSTDARAIARQNIVTEDIKETYGEEFFEIIREFSSFEELRNSKQINLIIDKWYANLSDEERRSFYTNMYFVNKNGESYKFFKTFSGASYEQDFIEFLKSNSFYAREYLESGLYNDKYIRTEIFMSIVNSEFNGTLGSILNITERLLTRNPNFKLDMTLDEIEELIDVVFNKDRREDEYYYRNYNNKKEYISDVSEICRVISLDSRMTYLNSVNLDKVLDEKEAQRLLAVISSLDEFDSDSFVQNLSLFNEAQMAFANGDISKESVDKVLDNLYYSVHDTWWDNDDDLLLDSELTTKDTTKIEKSLDKFRMQLALIGVNLDEIASRKEIEEACNCELREDFGCTTIYKNIISAYYNSLSKEDQKAYVMKLDNPFAFMAINDESKFKYMKPILKYKIVHEFDLGDSFSNVSFLLDYANEASNRIYSEYLTGLKALENSKLTLSPEEYAVLLKRIHELENRNLLDDKFSLSLANCTSLESKLNYLRTSPKDIEAAVNSMSIGELNQFFREIDDEQKAKIVLNINSLDFKSLSSFLPVIEDEYLRTQIVLTKLQGGLKDKEQALEDIGNYMGIKKSFLGLKTDEERVSFLISLEETESNDYNDLNEIKKSLLTHITKQDRRAEVISSMTKYVDPNIAVYRDAVEMMIREYFENNCDLTTEMRERMDIVLNSMHAYFTDYEKKATTGMCHHVYHKITLSNSRRGMDIESLLDLTHEYAHAFSSAEFRRNPFGMTDNYEEGMADIFAEEVINQYARNHRCEIMLGEKKIRLPYDSVSSSGYYLPNAVMKTLLYPTEMKRTDKVAISEYLLGDKKKFFELTIGMTEFNQDYMGNPMNVDIPWQDIYEHNHESFENLSMFNIVNSPYAQKNFLLPVYKMHAVASRRGKRKFLNIGSEQYNEEFIDKSYFGGRKLYEISIDDYEEFVKLYEMANCPGITCISGIDRFIANKFEELSEEEIHLHSKELLEILDVWPDGEDNLKMFSVGCKSRINSLGMEETREGASSIEYDDFDEI